MKTTTTALGLLFTSLAFSQVTVDETVFINTGATFYSDMAINVTTNGSLNVEGTLEVSGEITGDDKVTIGNDAGIILDAGTLTLAVTDEKFTDLTLGTTGILEVSPGNSLTLTGDLDNENTTDGIKLLADNTGYAQLLTTSASALTDKGTTYAEQYFTASSKEGWRAVSSPVATTLADIDDDFETYYPDAGKGGTSTVGTSSQWNVKHWDAATSNGTTTAHGWRPATNNELAFEPSDNAIAYLIYTGGLFDILNNGKLDVKGKIGHGDYTFNIYPTELFDNSVNVEHRGWNYIPNPYPSNIDLGKFFTDNTSHTAIYVWDSKNDQYSATMTDVSISLYPQQIDSTHNIAPFQGFLVKTNAAASATPTTLTLKNTYRTVTANKNYFKTTPEFVRLNTTSANGDIDQTILLFDRAAKDGLDRNDAFKADSENDKAPRLFTSVDGNDLSINRMSMPAPDKHIPLFFEQKDNREFTIDLVEATVDYAWMIELEDHKTGAIENLRTTSYTYKNDPSFVGNRFTVHIDRTGKKVVNTNAGNINIYGNADGLNVNFANFGDKQSLANVMITNLAGQIYFDGRVETDEAFVFPVSGVTCMYIVYVTVGTQTEVGKVVK